MDIVRYHLLYTNFTYTEGILTQLYSDTISSVIYIIYRVRHVSSM